MGLRRQDVFHLPTTRVDTVILLSKESASAISSHWVALIAWSFADEQGLPHKSGSDLVFFQSLVPRVNEEGVIPNIIVCHLISSYIHLEHVRSVAVEVNVMYWV